MATQTTPTEAITNNANERKDTLAPAMVGGETYSKNAPEEYTDPPNALARFGPAVG